MPLYLWVLVILSVHGGLSLQAQSQQDCESKRASVVFNPDPDAPNIGIINNRIEVNSSGAKPVMFCVPEEKET